MGMLSERGLGVPVRLVDERMTTAEATRGLQAAGRNSRSGRSVIDQAAAVIIVQHALDTERATGTPPGDAAHPFGGHPMSQLGLGMEPDTGAHARRDRRQRSGGRAVLVAAGRARRGGSRRVPRPAVPRRRGERQQFAGDGDGSVTVVVAKGDSLRQIGQTLADAGVVADEGSFTDAAESDSRAQSIAPGTYTLHEHMSGEAAVALMLDPSSRQVKKLAIPEGWRMDRILAAAAKATGLSARRAQGEPVARRHPGAPGLRRGQPGGLPVPRHLRVPARRHAPTRSSRRCSSASARPPPTPTSTTAAKALGRTPLEVVTVASILEIEGAPDDYDKVARVIYNRLDKGMRLQLDSTVNYALGVSTLKLSAAQLKTDSPYNTYVTKGLPPGPIDSPGDAALQAALNPADGPWLYFVTTDPKTKKTEFATTYDQFLVLKKKFQNAG